METFVCVIHTYISEGLSGNPWDHGTLGRLSMTACRYSEVDALPPTSVVRTCRQKWGGVGLCKTRSIKLISLIHKVYFTLPSCKVCKIAPLITSAWECIL